MDNWTDELFGLMCEKLASRKQRELDAISNRRTYPVSQHKVVPDEELFGMLGSRVKVVKNYGD